MQLRLFLLIGLAAVLGCQARERRAERGGLEVTALFADPDGHFLGRCLKDLARSYETHPDGILFFDRSSKLTVRPPRRAKSEPYHVHVLHRVAGVLLDQVVPQGDSGLVEVDLSRFDEPEGLVVTSAPLRLSERRERGAEGVIPGYAVSFKLIPSAQWQALVPLQHGRVELETPWGTHYTFVRPFNRRDMYVSWLDPQKTLRSLVEQEPYIYLKRADGYLPPRLVVDVSTGGLVWQRAGTWPMPDWIDRLEGPDAARPFVFRTPERELFSFGPPARLDLQVPKEPVSSSATVEARFIGVREAEPLKLVLACAFPVRGTGDYAEQTATYDVTASQERASYTISLDHLDPSSFPLTAALTHRFVQPWSLHGGMYRPVLPRERVILRAVPPGGRRKLHSHTLVPRCASHYELVTFFGDSSTAGRYRSLADAYHRGGDQEPSPNVVPPGPENGGSPPLPPAPPIPPAGSPGQDPGNEEWPSNGGLGGPPGGGGPKPPPGAGAGEITVTLACPGKGGCGMTLCTCPNHLWTQSALMQALWRTFVKRGPADISFFGSHGSTAPCHRVTRVGSVRVTYWGVGFQLIHHWYHVNVTFQPCMGVDQPPPPPPVPPPPPPPHQPPPEKPESGDPEGRPPVTTGGGRSGGDKPSTVYYHDEESGAVTITGDPNRGGESETISYPYNDPAWTTRGSSIAGVLGTQDVPTWAFSLSGSELRAIASGFGESYHNRPPQRPMTSSVEWVPSLPETWAVYQPEVPAPGGSPGGSSGGPPPSPPPPGPPPPTLPPCDPWDYYCTGQTKSRR
jgi:hypothetical protein